MKILAINASPRKNGNTSLLIDKALEPARLQGVSTEIFWLGNGPFYSCLGCRKCTKNKNQRCVIEEDYVNSVIQKMISSDVIILGSPVYVAGVSSQMKAFLDRVALVARANNFLLKHKIGVALVALRRAGALPTVDTFNHFFMIQQMFIVGSTYWNFAFGNEIGQISFDKEGLDNMQNLGENTLWLLNKLKKRH